MIPNLINTITGLVLAYVVVLHPSWAGHRYLPLSAFALVILAMAVWARRTDAHRWFSDVNIALAIGLGILSLLPLETLPDVTFWAGFWIACLVPTLALWAALYHPRPEKTP
jgi:hypothetical protein